jgi:fibronectin-binding autotransporter adhesin
MPLPRRAFAFSARVRARHPAGFSFEEPGAHAVGHRRRAATPGAVDAHVYAIANLYRQFGDAARVNVAGTDFTTRNERLWGGFGVGSSLDWKDGRYSVYGEVQATTGLDHFGDSHGVRGTAGFRMRW